jgi:hypothetical protein
MERSLALALYDRAWMERDEKAPPTEPAAAELHAELHDAFRDGYFRNVASLFDDEEDAGEAIADAQREILHLVEQLDATGEGDAELRLHIAGLQGTIDALRSHSRSAAEGG